MTRTVNPVASARKTARYWWLPRFLNASSGPQELDDRRSAPSPTQARNAASESAWNSCGSWKSLGPPSRIRLKRCHRLVGDGPGGSEGAGGGTVLGPGEGARCSMDGPSPSTNSDLRASAGRSRGGKRPCFQCLPDQPSERSRVEPAVVD